jgi:putative aldouronate transport system substrate-binding protein
MKSKRVILIVTAILILTIFFTACVRKETTIKRAGDTVKADKYEPIVEEKLTLRVLTDKSYPKNYEDVIPGDSDTHIYHKLEEITNVHLDFEVLPGPTNEKLERLAAAIAAKEHFDILTCLYGPIDKYGMEGALIPLQNLIKENAPNIQKVLEGSITDIMLPYQQNIKAEITAPDGNIYNIPMVSASNAIGPMISASNAMGPVYAIRDDWLKRLSLEIPDTPDDLYKVLKSFKHNDPNGNGEEDEVPFSMEWGPWSYELMPLINGFGAHISLYVDEADDTIKFGPVEQVYKEGMAFLNKLWKEGLIDQEWEDYGGDRWPVLISSNRLGFQYAWPTCGICEGNSELMKIDKNYQFTPILPLKGPDGKRFKDTTTTGGIIIPGAAAISVANKHPKETIKYLDFLFTNEGSKLMNYGIEGIHYNIIGGKPVFSDLIMKHPDGLSPADALEKELGDIRLPALPRCDDTFEMTTPEYAAVIEACKLYRGPGIVEAPLPTLHFTDDEFDLGPSIIDEIVDYIGIGYDDMMGHFIKGRKSLDGFDDFVAQIKRMGLDEALRIYNEAYKRYKSFAK